MGIECKFRLLAGLRFDEDAGVWVAFTPALDLYSQGRTKEEAKEAITSAAHLYLEGHYTAGSLHDTLCKRGFIPTENPFTPQARAEEEFISLNEYTDKSEIEVPMHLMRARNGELHAA